MRSIVFLLIIIGATNLLSAQNVGIGTTTPNYPLTVAADGSLRGIAQKNGTVEIGFWTSTGSAFLQTWSPHDLNFATNNGIARLTLANSTGYLGINTGSPSAQLDINGTFRLRGNGAGIGNVLTSDALGNATWQPLAGGWSLTGNSGTNPSLNFLGTVDNQPLMFRHNNIYAGRFHYTQRNYFIGNQAGVNTVAPHNIAIGDSALLLNTAGRSNVAIGSGALQKSPIYSGLVAIGDSALFKNGTFNDGGNSNYCTRNTAVGSKSLFGNSQGYQNTALGFEAGYNMGLGWSNTAIGAYAMRDGGSFGGEGNVAVGLRSLYKTTNLHNTGVGAYTLDDNTSGYQNTAVGHSSLSANVGGGLNTGVGYYSLSNNVSGDNNSALGSFANVQGTPAVSNATAIGTRAFVTQSNSIVLGAVSGVNGAGTSANIGIGTTAPSHALDVQANSVFGGRVHIRLHESANDYARMRFTNTNTANNWEIAGYPNTTNTTAFLNFFYSPVGDVLSLRGDGNAYLLGVLTQSDARMKKNIVPITASLNRLTQLNGYHYQWKDDNRDQAMQIGLLAQEVEKQFPELVKKNEKGILNVNYIGLVPVIINAMKEQQAKIDFLEKRLAALEEKLNQ